MPRKQYPSDATPASFETVRALLEGARRKTRPRKHDIYDVYCAVLFFLSTKGPWRSLPPDLPPWRTVHEYFMQWTAPQRSGASLLEQALARTGPPVARDQLRVLMSRR